MFGFRRLPCWLRDGPLSAVLFQNDVFPNRWVTNRYEPNEFVHAGIYQGRHNVLRITTTAAEGFANRPGGQQSTFYDTQARSLDLWGGPKSVLESSIYVPSEWADRTAFGSKRSGMFANTGSDADPSGLFAFAFVEFSNDENNNRPSADPGFYWWDNAGNFALAATPVLYDDWNTLSLVLMEDAPGVPAVGDPTSNFFVAYYINGAYVGGFYTDGGVPDGRNWNGFGIYIYNFFRPEFVTANPVDYSTHWAAPLCTWSHRRLWRKHPG